MENELITLQEALENLNLAIVDFGQAFTRAMTILLEGPEFSEILEQIKALKESTETNESGIVRGITAPRTPPPPPRPEGPPPDIIRR